MKQFDLKAYARAGAEARLREIESERQAILSAFPDLTTTAPRRRGRPLKNAATAAPKRRRKRGKLSAEGRRRISEAQKKRWAALKAQKK